MAPVEQNLEEQYKTILGSITDGVYAAKNYSSGYRTAGRVEGRGG